MNVDPELRERVEQIKSSPVQLYREAGDYSNRELVEGIVVSPDDIAAIEAVARASADDPEFREAVESVRITEEWGDMSYASLKTMWGLWPRVVAALGNPQEVEPDHYQRWER